MYPSIYQNSLLFFSRAKNVVAAARPPVRFFSAEAPVVDLYLGQLDQARMQKEHEQDVVLHYKGLYRVFKSIPPYTRSR